ncbi:MAG: type I polyketide synthase [Candidatus Accumulibacter sp.]|nr:type I polyketide synthase [Accumulibacter sp.]
MTTRVAITGYSFRLPGTTADTYWQDLLEGRDLVGEVPADRWAFDTFLHPQKTHPGTSYTFSAGSIGDVANFDAGFFGISPREAALMDPQQRLLLEMSWEAIENSGIAPSRLRGSDCGVYIGLASLDYSFRMADDLAVVDAAMATGNTASIAANRISYAFDLRGPSMAIDTACSSSMVAFHQACRAIVSGETGLALTGGISLHLHPYGFLVFAKASMLSPRGRCRVFDASGDGYVRSEGGGMFLLKNYEQALADGDPILAVVVGSAVNTDGRKSGLTVPSAQAQAALLEKVYAQAGVDPLAINYLEAHGTGTAVGDPIETRALGDALGRRRPADQPLPIGSVKSNMGHLETASGVAGLIKALHCLQYRTVPATIGLETTNPAIDFTNWNLTVVTRNLPLPPTGKLTIGINSFGFGGANAHVVLESPPECAAPPTPPDRAPGLLPVMVSARTSAALQVAAAEFAEFLAGQAPDAFYDIAYSAFAHRERHDHRLVVFAEQAQTVVATLREFAGEESAAESPVSSGTALANARGAVFLYSGNGSQWAGMGQRLLAEEPRFRQAVREVDALFRRYADYSLEDELAGRNGDDRYQFTEIAQPALFAIQVGITQLLGHRGLTPIAVVGHSVGEVAAAWAAGALTLADAVEVIYQRSRLQGLTKGCGAMSAVALGQEACEELLRELALDDHLAVAGINSSRGVTVAGLPEKLHVLETTLAERQISWKRLDLDYAFHSPAMDGIEAEIRDALSHVRPKATTVPFISTVSGGTLPGQQLHADYWWLNVRQPVRFASAINVLLDQGVNLFVEIGPHPILRSYVSDCLHDLRIEGRVIPTLRKTDDSPRHIWQAAEQSMIAGASIDWPHFFPSPGRRIRLPNYPWQRERYWHPVTSEAMGLLYRRKCHPLLGYPLPQHALLWENQLDTSTLPMLADHVVGDATVFPGAGFAELALSAELAWHNASIVAFDELEIRSPLVLNEGHSSVIRTRIDPQDGSLTISSRELLSDDPWTVHVVARLLGEANESSLNEILPALPTRAADFAAEDHAELTRSVGIAYGPAFQCIDHGWCEGNSVFGVLRIPPVIDPQMALMHLHPALLDGAFQLVFQLLRENAAGNEGIAYVPSKLGRLIFRAGQPPPAFARATLLRHSPRSLQAEFVLFAADGRAVARLRDVRFRSVRLSRGAADRLRYLSYRAIPRPHPLAAPEPASLLADQVRSALAEVVRRAALQGTSRRYSDEVDPLLDSLCSRFTRMALQQLAAEGSELSSTFIADLQAAHPETAPLLTRLLAHATDDESIVASDAGGWRLLPDPRSQSSAQDIWNALVTDDPDYFQIIHSVGRIGMHLHDLLTGVSSLAELCPQETSPSSLLRQVVGSRGKQKLGRALRQLVAQGFAGLPDGRRMTVVEISQGAPWFARDVCVAIDFDRGDYRYVTSSSSTLDDEFARLKEAFPAIQGSLLEGSRTGGDVGSAGGPGYDLAIVTLDFDTVDQALLALDHLSQRLTPGASLIVIAQHPSRWIDFVFGARRSAWTLDEQGHWLSNQRSSVFWRQQLQGLGLHCPEPYEFSPETLSGPYLLVAHREHEALARQAAATALTTPRSWILLADKDPYSSQLSDQLAETLCARGDMVIQSPATETGPLVELLHETTAQYGELDGLVHLFGLLEDAGNESADQAVARQVARCATAANILQACTLADQQTTCWVITANATTRLLPGRVPSLAGRAADSALWGFGRTLLNEAEPCTVRLIDLETPMAVERAAFLLDCEFEQPDDEQEVVLTAAGERYALRLRSEPPPSTAQQLAIKSPTVTLGFQFPGQLRNLRWEARPAKELSAGEIEVEVRATGLNFRDVMFALGLLSDEAIENGFAGPTLGFEFAGVVSRVGDSASNFSPGDEVVGFGPSSFGNRVVTQSNAIAPIPPEMSFEAAATIPSTFLTVYYALHHLARLQPDERVLIHGAAGGVGIAAVQVAKWLGAEIHATAGSNEKRDFLRLLGVDHIYDSRSLVFAEQILERTAGEGVDVVLNSLAGEAINRNFQVLRPFGRFLELGKRDFYENTRLGLRPFRNNLSYFGIDADQLMLKQPALTRRLFGEIMALFNEGVLHPLPYHTFEAEDVVDAFRYMQQARQIGKIVITYPHGIDGADFQTPSAARRRLQLSGDASYLISGGLSGFGLRTAEWLVSKGARQLVLLSRRGPTTDEAQQALSRFAAQGVTVLAAACDVSNRRELSQLLDRVAASMPPLKGVVHAAAVIDDALIRNLDANRIGRVLAPKMLGAYHLDELTRHLPLELFILFSSATAAFGNPGQASYVAANAALDALAGCRRASGLPATVIGWGPIDDVGFLARNEKIKDALQSRMGGAAIKSAVALDALEAVLLGDRSDLAIMELDWKALGRFLPTAATPKFSDLAGQADDSDAEEDHADDIERLINELPDEELHAVFVQILKNEIGEILRLSADKIDAQRSLYDQGLDSLMGVELAVALEARFGIRLPVMALSQAPTIAKLADRLIHQLRGHEESESSGKAEAITEQAKKVAEQHGVEVSSEMLADLADILPAGGSGSRND